MKDDLQEAMREATRLTQSGRLAEASALIRRALQGERGAAATVGTEPDAPTGSATLEGDYHLVQEGPDHGPRARDSATGATPQADAEGSRGAAGRLLAGSYGCEAGARDYRLYVPGSVGSAAEGCPLLVMLHGCGQDPDGFAAVTGMSRLADRLSWMVLYPAQSLAANGSGCWGWFSLENQRRGGGEPMILAGMIRRLMSEHPVDPARVYIAGFSAGGAMAMTMAATYSELLAAVGVHSGLPYAAADDLISALSVMRQGSDGRGWDRDPQALGLGVPTIAFHGDADTTVHFSNAYRIMEQGVGKLAPSRVGAEAPAEAGGRAVSRRLYRDARGRTLGELWIVHGAGHGWLGGQSASGWLVEREGPDASREMLRFFAQHARPRSE